MKDFLNESKKMEEARASVASMALNEIDVSNRELFYDNTIHAYFERLRRDDPVHFHETSAAGLAHWSVTKFEDIKYVDTNHELFSNEPGIILTRSDAYEIPSFLNMDPPRHDEMRMAVAPIVSPTNLGKLEGTIRERAGAILDELPVGEEFDWVRNVSVELTSQMLATLMNFPMEKRRQLIRWSDLFSLGEDQGEVFTKEERKAETAACLDYFSNLRDKRAKEGAQHDIVSLLAHGEATRNLQGNDFLANIMLLIVGGNDTTRNSISGSVLALNTFPEQYEKLRNDHSLVKNLVPEVIRWQTPLAHMMRRAVKDVELGGKRISKDDRVVMWYVSGNRDEDAFDDAHEFRLDRPNSRQHVSFGFGLHRCLGNRLAEMQLRVLWEEIMKRFSNIEVVGPPERARSHFIRGYLSLPVVIHE